MVFALQSSNPSSHAQKAEEQPVGLGVSEEVSLRLGVVSEIRSAEVNGGDECMYSDYWQRFQHHEEETFNVLQHGSTSEALDHMPLRKQVKVL